jgi:hypothetical protein
MDKKLKQELKTAFNPPIPTRKNEFLSNLQYPKSSNLDFFFSQIWYIRKRFWCLSVLIVIALVRLIQMNDTTFKTIAILSAFLPYLVVLSVAEISKSTSYNMVEMEMSCKYNLGKISLIRLSIIGSFQFMILLCMVWIFAINSEYSFLHFSLYCITPFLLCSYLSLFITNHFPIRDTAYICAGVAGIVSISVFILTFNFGMIYLQKYVFIWSMVFIFTAILLLKEIKNFIKRTEELQWNFPLIA